MFHGFWQCLVTLVHLHEVQASFTKINLSKKKKKLFTKKSNGCKDFKSTAISENFMKMDVKVHDFYTPKIGATYRTVLEFNGLKYQWA